MNAKKNKPTTAPEAAEPDREIDAPAPGEAPQAPPPVEEEIIDLGAEVAPNDTPDSELTPEQIAARDAANNIDTTHAGDVPAEADEVIDLGDTSVGHTVIGGGLEVAPEPTSPVGITQPLVPAIEDVADFAKLATPTAELNALDESDPARSAALRSQANWLEDSKTMKAFQGPDRDELARIDHIAQMDQIDRRNRDQQAKDDEVKAKREKLENRAKLIADLKGQYENLKQQAMIILGQIKELEAIEAEPEGGA